MRLPRKPYPMCQPNSKSVKQSRTAKVAGYAAPVIGFFLLLGGMMLGFTYLSQSPSSSPTRAELNQAPSNTTDTSLEPAANWQANNHVHGLAVSPEDPQVVYVASHNGLLKHSNGQWFWVQPEQERADYMGFTGDPINPDRFYASGHPPTGGNLGFQVSENRGQDWKQVSMPGVDFHTLAVAPSDSNRFYAWAASGAQGLFVSTDGGKTWTQPQMVGLGNVPFSFEVDPRNSDYVFATTEAGLYKSINGGDDWTLVSNTQGAPVTGLALSQEGDNTVLYGYRLLQPAPGLYRSTDNGNTWEPLGAEVNGTILHLTAAPNNPQILYAVNENNAVLRSQNSGKTWKELS